MDEFRLQWNRSKLYRVLVIAAVVYGALQLAMQAYLMVDMVATAVITPEGQVASDLQIYITAAHRFLAHEDMYLESSLPHPELQFLYSPAFALMLAPILLLPLPVLVPLFVILHLAAYGLMYVWWGRIFKRLNLTRAHQMLITLLPLWIVFSAFWDDVAYLNIYIIMALVATLFIDAILEEKLGWAIFWLGVIILPFKPHWAFAAALPLLLGRRKFFVQLLVGSVAAYLLVAGATILIGGLEYGLKQYTDYVAFLARLSRDYAWRGPDSPFLGYNHSVMQTMLYFFGLSPAMMKAVALVKSLLLVPLGVIGIRCLIRPRNQRAYENPRLALDLGFALYLGAFLWLDMVWELSLGIAIFTYLVGTFENKKLTPYFWIIFVPYAGIDIWRLLSYIILGDAVLYDGSYVLTDPLVYFPWILMVLIVFYAVFLGRIWKSLDVHILK